MMTPWTMGGAYLSQGVYTASERESLLGSITREAEKAKELEAFIEAAVGRLPELLEEDYREFQFYRSVAEGSARVVENVHARLMSTNPDHWTRMTADEERRMGDWRGAIDLMYGIYLVAIRRPPPVPAPAPLPPGPDLGPTPTPSVPAPADEELGTTEIILIGAGAIAVVGILASI